jgi:hypothetical protein
MEQENVDEIMRGVQGASEKTQVDRFYPVSVRMGVAGTLNSVYVMETDEWKGRTVAKIIEFYIPIRFSKREKRLPTQECGRLIEFRVPTRESA